MDRRQLLAWIPAAAGIHGAAAADETLPPIPGAYSFLPNSEVSVSVSSHPVSWKGYDYHLVRIGKAAPGSPRSTTWTTRSTRPSSTLRGRLLGTASTVCPVTRMWARWRGAQDDKVAGAAPVVGVSLAKLHLDFGVSEAYKRGEWFTMGITERKVLTPDQWADEKG